MDYKKLGERIRTERLRLNLTQTQLAENAGIRIPIWVLSSGESGA